MENSILYGLIALLTTVTLAAVVNYFLMRRNFLHLVIENANLKTEIGFQQANIYNKEEILLRSQQQFQTLLESMSQKALIANNESFLK